MDRSEEYSAVVGHSNGKAATLPLQAPDAYPKQGFGSRISDGLVSGAVFIASLAILALALWGALRAIAWIFGLIPFLHTGQS